jgi:GNAT superfamily N-acetyltransferase
MTRKARKSKNDIVVRPLVEGDLAAVIEIDAGSAGRARHGFFERRLQAALKSPKSYIYVGAERDGDLKGFVLVRLVAGEFGADETVAVLDALGVHPQAQGRGIGQAMLAEIDAVARAKGISEMQTQTAWTDHDLLRFFEHRGFAVGGRLVLSRPVDVPDRSDFASDKEQLS